MATEYNSILKCKSNPTLLQSIDPREIIKESPAKFITCKNGEYHFQSQRLPIHEDVFRLSKEYPEEEFIVKDWNANHYYSEMRTINFKGGEAEIIRTEPHFNYECRSPRLKDVMGEERFNVFFKKITSFFEKLKGLYYEKWLESDAFGETMQYDEISIQFEDDEFRVMATWDSCSHISIEGFYKVTNQTSWKLIDEHSYIPIKHRKNESVENENEDEYNDLPF